VGLLHSRPRRVLGRRIDHFAARNHRMHHRDPWDCRFTVMPLQTATIVFAFTAITWYLAMPTLSSFLSGLLATGIAGLVYEWTHFLIHTSYRPRSRAYRRLWRLHRLHHFKNERYWHCLVMPVGDRLLGTAPDPERVEASATARTLGVETDRA
jgi:sterol desaturase/sphingolipid hydroxylase (fatty acid hydroxylase superfamily)